MPASDLTVLFDALPSPSIAVGSGARFATLPISDHEFHRVGKDAQGAPLLLIAVADTAGRARPAPIVLEHLTVQHDMPCRVLRPDGTVEERRFTVVRCTGTDSTLRTYFLRLTSTIVAALGTAPSRADVAGAIERLAELFRALAEPPRKTMRGLWAELLVIAQGRDPAALIGAWHTTLEDRYDFSLGSQRIEVKSTTGRARQHHFSLEQLIPPAGTDLLVASLFVEQAGAGISVAELAGEIRARVANDPQAVLHVDRIVALTLGEGWRRAGEERFDRELAESSLAFFEPAVIPAVGVQLPRGVSEVRFKSDLIGCPTADLAYHRAAGKLFRAALNE